MLYLTNHHSLVIINISVIDVISWENLQNKNLSALFCVNVIFLSFIRIYQWIFCLLVVLDIELYKWDTFCQINPILTMTFLDFFISDINPPEITCPTSYAVQVSENITQTVMSNSQPANATDNSGEAPTITYSPATFDVSHLNFSTSVSIMATATDGAGNTASCTFAVAVECELDSFYLLSIIS